MVVVVTGDDNQMIVKSPIYWELSVSVKPVINSNDLCFLARNY
jgi:hypothetical protein